MADLMAQAQPAVENLLQSDEPQLYETLAMRVKAMESNPAIGGSFEPDVTYDAEHMGISNDLREFGQRFFNRLSRQAFNVACGAGADQRAERKKLTDAMHLGPETVAAALAALLVAHLGMAAAVAAVVASLVVKLCYNAGGTTLCEMWQERLPPENGTPANG